MVVWLKRVTAILAAIVAVSLLWRSLLIAVSAVAVLFACVGLWILWSRWRATQRFRSVYGAQGKIVLLVYWNSPNWQRYVEKKWLPKWGHRAAVLNWSERSKWQRSSRAEALLFRAFAGARQFNPLVIVVPPTGRRVHVVRFWRAFRDYKHGKDHLLRSAEAEVGRYLELPNVPDRPLPN